MLTCFFHFPINVFFAGQILRDTTIYSLNVPILGRWCRFFGVRRNLHGLGVNGIRGSFGRRLGGKVKIFDMLLIIWSCRRWYIFCGVSATTGVGEVPSGLRTNSHIRYSVSCGHGWSPSPFPILYRTMRALRYLWWLLADQHFWLR